jgi:uncharacterized protein YjhX (UPF0386 family)
MNSLKPSQRVEKRNMKGGRMRMKMNQQGITNEINWNGMDGWMDQKPMLLVFAVIDGGIVIIIIIVNITYATTNMLRVHYCILWLVSPSFVKVDKARCEAKNIT